jgi:hypothetical protein
LALGVASSPTAYPSSRAQKKERKFSAARVKLSSEGEAAAWLPEAPAAIAVEEEAGGTGVDAVLLLPPLLALFSLLNLLMPGRIRAD